MIHINKMIKSKYLLIIAAIVFFAGGSVFAKPFPYSGDMTAGVSGAEENWDAYADLLLPLAGKPESFFFINPRASMTGKRVFESSANEFNIGAGYRKYFSGIMKDGAVIGANLYYDARNTGIGDYQQAGIGIEFLSKRTDIRANVYIPFGNNDNYLGKLYNVFEGNNIAATYYYELAMRGFDGEIGFNIPLPEYIGEFRVFGGYYHFVSDKVGKRYHGLKARAEYRPVSILSLSASMFQYEHLTGAQWQAGAAVSVPFSFVKMIQGKNPFGNISKLIRIRTKPVKERMGEMVQRDMYVRTYMENKKVYSDLVSDEDGIPYHFTVVSPGGTGNGTFKNPAELNAGAQINKNIAGNNAVLLLLGGEYILGSTLDLSGHQAKKVIISGRQYMTDLGVDLSLITVSDPVIKTAGSITAFKAGSSGTESFAVAAIEFEGAGNTGTGLEINNNEAVFYIGNNSFSGFETGLKIESFSGSVRAYNNIADSNDTGVRLAGENIVFEQNIVSANSGGFLIESGKDINVVFNRIENNGYAVNIKGSTGTVVYGNEINGNVYSALNVDGSYGSIIEENLFEHNGQNGIVLTGGASNFINANLIAGSGDNGIKVYSSSEVFITDNDIYENEGDGIYLADSVFSGIENNRMDLNGQNGINIVNSKNLSVFDNRITSSAKSGIYIDTAQDIVLENNFSSLNTENGMYFANVSNMYVYENESSANGFYGMYFKSVTDAGISKSVASNNAYDGMAFEDVSNAEIYDNRAEQNSGSGIFFNSGTCVNITGNKIYDNIKDGINFNNVSVSTLSSNHFAYSGGNGGYFSNISGVDMFDNSFVENGSEGAKIENVTGGYIEGNLFEGNFLNGMIINAGTGTVITDNASGKNKENGFNVIGGSDIYFYANSIYENEKAGINIENGSMMNIVSNVMQNNNIGINIADNSDLSVQNNTVKHNDGGGIYLSNISSGEISKNIVNENGGFGGIYGENFTGAVSISSNSVSSNTYTGITLVNTEGASLAYNILTSNGGLGGIYGENFNNGSMRGNSAYYNNTAGITLKGGSNAVLYNNGLYYTETGHGLRLDNVSGVTLETNFYQMFGTTDKNGLDLRGNITFDASSGNNNFINSSWYGGDLGAVINYETNLKSKDNFY